MPFYRLILKNAWNVTRRYKFLWFFGLFASLTSNGEEYDLISRNYDTVQNMDTKIASLRTAIQDGKISEAWENIRIYFVNNTLSSILVILAALVILLIIVWLITVSQTAIINSANFHREKKQNNFIDGFIVGNKFFVPIFILNIIAKLIIYGGLLVFGIPLTIGWISSGNFTWLAVLSVFVFLFLIPINMIISFIVKYASAYVILKGRRAWDGFREGWRLFLKNWLISLELAVILFVINFTVGYVIVALLAFTGIPFNNVGFYFFYFAVMFFGALLATFQFSSWTFLFLDLSENKGVSKLIRIFYPNRTKNK